MNSIDRRDFLKKLAITLAGSTASLTFSSCSLIKAGYRQMKPGIDHNAILTDYKEKFKLISQDHSLKLVEDYLQQRQCNPFMVQDSILSLNAVATFGDLPEEDRKHPAIQQMMRDASPVVDRSTLSTATYLEQLSIRERLDIQNTMHEHPEILSTFQVEFDVAARKNNIPPSRLDHFNALFNKCVWRLENQDPSLIIDEIVAMTDKTCAEYSISPEKRRELVAELNSPEYYDLAYSAANTDISEIYDPGLSEMLVQVPADTSVSYRAEQYQKWLKVRDKGASWVLWGIVQFGVGTALLYGFGNSVEILAALGLFVGMTGGALIAITGLIMAIVGAIGAAIYD
jgi:hypothetical protein